MTASIEINGNVVTVDKGIVDFIRKLYRCGFKTIDRSRANGTTLLNQKKTNSLSEENN
jgi:hypothetical protein